MNSVKLKDIAAATGVSVSTVSRILSGDKSRKVKAETAAAVLDTANSLGYYSTKKNKLRNAIGKINIAVLFVSDNENILSPFFSEIIEGITNEINGLSDYMNIAFEILSLGSDAFESRLCKKNLDGAIILGRTQESVIARIKDSVPNYIYAGLNSMGNMDEVICDAKEGIKEGVSYLYRSGARRIAYIGPTYMQNDVMNEYRYLGYVEALADLKLEHDETLVENVLLKANEGYAGAERLLSRSRPDAIVAANDNVALGVLKALASSGVRVPEEVSVIGFDNIDVSAFSSPSLTTFDVPKKELGHFAVRFLLDRIENPRERNIRITIPYQLIERESTRK